MYNILGLVESAMNRKYNNPPIIEAVCEFRLPPETKWDLTIPGLLYEKLRNTFPCKEQRLFQEVELKKNSQGVEQLVHTRERAIFLTEDRRSFIQVGLRLLAVNCLKSYPRWNIFKRHIERAFKALLETVEIRRIYRIGLRYINRIEITNPGPSFELADYFDFRPFLGEKLPKDISGFAIRCVLPFPKIEAECNLQLTTAVQEKPGNRAFILDLDYYPSQLQTIASNDALAWIEEAHEKIVEIFEGCITDKLRQQFGEVK
ncbi:MAG: TIGR04255 family protein [bacterium]